MENKDQMLVTMTMAELDDIVFRAAYRASRKVEKEFFKGILPFFDKMNDDFEQCVMGLDSVNLKLQSQAKKKKNDTRWKKENEREYE